MFEYSSKSLQCNFSIYYFSWAIINCITNMLVLMNRAVQRLLNMDGQKL